MFKDCLELPMDYLRDLLKGTPWNSLWISKGFCGVPMISKDNQGFLKNCLRDAPKGSNGLSKDF